MGVTEDRRGLAEQGAVGDSFSLALHALESKMRRQSDRRIKTAMQVQVLRLAGHSRQEIQEQLELSADEYSWAWRKLRDANQPGADE